jgi:hypothetical protein
MRRYRSASSRARLYPDHDTLATFRRTFLPELKDLFVQVLLLAQEAGVLTLGTISLDGTKLHADASKHNAVSYKRLLELEAQLDAEVEELFTLSVFCTQAKNICHTKKQVHEHGFTSLHLTLPACQLVCGVAWHKEHYLSQAARAFLQFHLEESAHRAQEAL